MDGVKMTQIFYDLRQKWATRFDLDGSSVSYWTNTKVGGKRKRLEAIKLLNAHKRRQKRAISSP